MARSNRSSRSARPEQPARFADGTAVPPDLLALVPPEPPATYLGGPEHHLPREGAVPENGPRLWDVLHRMHPEPPFFADALVVSTEREEVRPLEECRVTARPGPRNN